LNCARLPRARPSARSIAMASARSPCSRTRASPARA
jgi:hypothetical protein